MTSILIARLPPHPKSPKAIEFMQENGFFFRITSNSPLANLLMSSGEVEDCVAQMMGLSEEFKPEKEEIEIVKELMMTQVNGNLQERRDFIDQPVNKDEQPVEQEKSILEPVKVKDEEDSDGMEGVFETTTEEPPQENVAAIIHPPITDSLGVQTLSAAVQSKNSEELIQNLSSQLEPAMEANHDRVLDDILESVDADESTISLHPLQNDDPLGSDASFEEDLLEQEAMDKNENEEMEEFEEEDELIEEEEKHEEGENCEVDDDTEKKEKEDSDEEDDKDDEKEVCSGEEDEGIHEEQRTRKETRGSPLRRHLFTCPVKDCISSFKKFEELEKHMKIHCRKQDFHCDVCEKSFSSKETAMEHIQERKKKECCKCGKKFSLNCHLAQHLRSHTGEKPFECKTCKKSFGDGSTLTTHMFTHSKKKPFSCGFCKKGFAQKTSLKTHERTHTGEKPYKCKQCDFRSCDRSNMNAHNRIHTGERPYSCGHCEKRYARKGQLKTHELTHSGEKPFKCSHCEKRFCDRRGMNTHFSFHTGQKPFSCKECAKKFTRNDHLKRHMKRIHQS